MALGDTVHADGIDYEVVFDGERWFDGRVGLLTPREDADAHVPSERAQQPRAQSNRQDRAKRFFR